MIYTNNLNLPQALYNAVVEGEKRVHNSDATVTELTNAPRPFYLKRRHNDEITIDISDRLFTIYGRMVHTVMEKYAPEDTITEERLRCNVNGWQVSGQPDLMDEKQISDWKLTSSWVIIFDSNREEYARQLNLYRYLAKQNGFGDIDRLENIFLLRDWSRTKAKHDAGYPQKPVEIVQQAVHPYDDVGKWLDTRVREFQNLIACPDDNLPVCSPEARWRKPDSWALKKEGRKTAIKVCSNEGEAKTLCAQKYKGADSIEYRPGIDLRCHSYCDAKNFCSYYRSLVRAAPEPEEE